ncbi:DUF5317 domain-containing protein [Thermosipho ferrireducens]|uniref:DUF5317 domain-containing protein n=1 Tax=Thermosipho ferrireducens TaxID=2571116 RepID=A0ABX7SAB3_9BACT|nr:DUF5317 family protein [Thermosipho ferrireducens]QTA38356.1 DUF5317 domain-containing protein [Thermosipho ferrireducens]
MIIYVFVAALIVSLITKRIKYVVERTYRYIYLFPIPFILQLLPYFRGVLMPLSFAMLITLLILNKHIPGFKFMAIGTLLNSFVMMIFGWKMPALKSLVEQMGLRVGVRHTVVDKFDIKLLLGDWIPVYLPWNESFIISIGDIFVYVGIFMFMLGISSMEKTSEKI